MNKKCLLLSVASILSVMMATSNKKINTPLKANETILVGEATTFEEKIEVAARELSLNIDEKHVVTTLNLVYKGLYGTEISYVSSNEKVLEINDDLKQGIVHRTDKDENVVLTAKIVLRDKENVYERTKEFNLTILKRKVQTSTENKVSSIEEDFTSYDTGEEISEYLKWNLSSGEGGATIVDSVPNNNIIPNQKALKIPSKRTAQTTNYITNFALNGEYVFEGYLMYVGDINGVYFDLGNSTFGPSFGIKDGTYYYNKNGDKPVDKAIASPKEGVWTKFRIEVDSTTLNRQKYSLKIYKMDGSGETIDILSSYLYSTAGIPLNKLRIRVAGGSKVGEVYASNLVIKSKENMPVLEGYNPNRTEGIGRIEGYKESVLYINGEEKDYESGFDVYNRFDENEKYVEGEDYTITKEVISSNEKKDINKYTITLKATNETKELTQEVYKEDRESAPSIENFKSSHLAQKVIDEATGALSSTGSITITGLVSRSDSSIYYAVQNKNEAAPSVQEVVDGTKSSFVKKGVIEQTVREVNFSIDELSLDKEYDVYVVIKNDYGTSSMYQKEAVSKIINITTCEEFYDMTVNIDTYKNEFRLMNDLDFSSFVWPCDMENKLKFQGKLEGNNHTIRNLSIQSPYRKAAIFYEITDATIRNLNFVDTSVSGLQDSAVIAGYSNGGTIENISLINTKVCHNGESGSEGYFALIAGRLHKGTTNMKNINIDGAYISSNKYTGVLTGNVNKGTGCVLNVENVYVDANIRCDGAAVGLIGRNRGTTNINNAVVFISVDFAKKEMGAIAGHNKEGGVLNVKNVIGTLDVSDCTQPTYFNYFIGSQDDNTSKYTYENVYFLKADYSSISDSITPTTSTRTCGVLLTQPEELDAKWYETYTFIHSFELDTVWSFDPIKSRPVLDTNKDIDINASMVNELIGKIKGDLSDDDHYYIYKAELMYSKLSDTEKAKVNKAKLDEEKAKWETLLDAIDSIIGGN